MSAPNGQGSIAVPSKPLTPEQYKQYALQDPGFLALQSSLQGNEDAFRANARGGINKGVIGLGLAPADSSLNGWLDAGTADAAAANPLSTGAQLSTAHTANMRSIQNNLAARGGYNSGELTYGLGNENTRDTSARADALSKFMDYANGLFGQLGSMQSSDASQLGSELGSAAMRQLALHPGTTTTATWDDSKGFYVDSDGNLYDQWGNHVTSDGPPTNFGPVAPHNDQLGAIQGLEPPAYNPVATSPGGLAGAYMPPPPQNPSPIITHGAPPRMV